jgi:hypothetical protein
MTINEKFEVCRSNGLTAGQSLIGALPIHEMVDFAVLEALVLEQPVGWSHKVHFFKN